MITKKQVFTFSRDIAVLNIIMALLIISHLKSVAIAMIIVSVYGFIYFTQELRKLNNV